MTYLKKRRATIILLAGSFLFGLSFAQKGYASSTQPGTATDPLVSQSYVDARISQLQSQINSISTTGTGSTIDPASPPTMDDSMSSTVTDISSEMKDQIIEDIMKQLDFVYGKSINEENTSIYQPVFASAGQYIICGEGTEIILRSGGAVGYLGDALNGIVNATTGIEIVNGTPIPINNILIVPRDDGRGVKLTVDSWFIIKGGFEIK